MYPDRDTFWAIVPRSGYITARDQNMAESGVTEAGKTLPIFTFGDEHDLNTTMSPPHKHEALS